MTIIYTHDSVSCSVMMFEGAPLIRKVNMGEQTNQNKLPNTHCEHS